MFCIMVDTLYDHGFKQESTPLLGLLFVKGEWHVHIQHDGYFQITFPDGHSGDCRAGSTKDPAKALERVLLAYTS